MRALLLIAALPGAAAAPGRFPPPRPPRKPVPDVNCTVPQSRPPALPASRRASKGPTNGLLVVAGGSLKRDSPVFARMLELAGGREAARIVYVPTNGGGTYETPAQRERELDSFLQTSGWGDLAHPVTLTHSYDRAAADEPGFYAPIDEATGVYFSGGLPYRSYDAYFGTGTQQALERLLARGGVLGGSSAGALMQGNVMLRGCRDCSRGNAQMIGDPYEGFGFGGMENLMFDVHYMHRRRSFDIIEAFGPFPDFLGVSIDEDTAVVLRGDEMEVVSGSNGWAAVYDPTLWQPAAEVPHCADFRLQTGTGRVLLPNHGRFFMLRDGARYNVHTREVTAAAEPAGNMTTEWDYR